MDTKSSNLRFMLCSFSSKNIHLLVNVCACTWLDNKVSDHELFIYFEQLNHVPGIFVQMLPVLVRTLVGDKAWFQLRHYLRCHLSV